MIEYIKAVVEAGGTVEFPSKYGVKHHMNKATIFKADVEFLAETPYVFSHPCGLEKYPNLDDALRDFVQHVFSRRNLGLAICGIRKHKLTKKDLDDCTEEELKVLIQKYWEEYYYKDYPWRK